MTGGDSMENKDLWKAFTQTGRVEDYLRYRGVIHTAGDNVVQEGGAGHGHTKTAYHDRGPDPSRI